MSPQGFPVFGYLVECFCYLLPAAVLNSLGYGLFRVNQRIVCLLDHTVGCVVDCLTNGIVGFLRGVKRLCDFR